MNGVEKVAILFRVLGTDFAQPMTATMRPEEIARVGEAMVRFEQDPPEEEDVVDSPLPEPRERCSFRIREKASESEELLLFAPILPPFDGNLSTPRRASICDSIPSAMTDSPVAGSD